MSNYIVGFDKVAVAESVRSDPVGKINLDRKKIIYYNDDVEVEVGDFLIEFTDTFNKFYPVAGFGPGHLVLDDDNWDSINFCLNEIKLLREGKSETYDKKYMDDPDDEMYKELDEVEAFLKFLKVITDKLGIEQTLVGG